MSVYIKPRLYAQLCTLIQIYSGCKIAPESKFAPPHVSVNCVHMLLHLLLKHNTNVSVFFKEKFEVLRMLRLVSSRYRRVRKMQLHFRLRAKKGPAPPPLGNFADISYLEENFKPHLLRDVCTLCSGALVSDSLLHMLL